MRWNFLLDFNYDEIELISKILNFKIINKKDTFENKIITEKNFSEKLKTVNNMLNAEKLGQIVETKEYLSFLEDMTKNSKMEGSFQISKFNEKRNDLSFSSNK